VELGWAIGSALDKFEAKSLVKMTSALKRFFDFIENGIPKGKWFLKYLINPNGKTSKLLAA
jgi:hypothetical protein